MSAKVISEAEMVEYCNKILEYTTKLSSGIKLRENDFRDLNNVLNRVKDIRRSTDALIEAISNESPDTALKERQSRVRSKINNNAVSSARNLYRELKSIRITEGYKTADTIHKMAKLTESNSTVSTELRYEMVNAKIVYSNGMTQNSKISLNHLREDYERYIRTLAYSKYLLCGGDKEYNSVIGLITSNK